MQYPKPFFLLFFYFFFFKFKFKKEKVKTADYPLYLSRRRGYTEERGV
jgi:hypothetical protein